MDVNTVEELNENNLHTVRACVDRVCPKIQTVRKKDPWEDDCLQKLMEEVKNCKQRVEVRKKQKKVRARRNNTTEDQPKK